MSAKPRKKLPPAPRARQVVVQMRLEEDERNYLAESMEQLTAATDRFEELLQRASDAEVRMVKILAELREIEKSNK